MKLDEFVAAFVARLRDRAEQLHLYAAAEAAATCVAIADELECDFAEWWSSELSVAEAAGECGYTPDYLRELVRKGELQHRREAGSKSEIRVRRCDLPKRSANGRSDVTIAELANQILNDRGNCARTI